MILPPSASVQIDALAADGDGRLAAGAVQNARHAATLSGSRPQRECAAGPAMPRPLVAALGHRRPERRSPHAKMHCLVARYAVARGLRPMRWQRAPCGLAGNQNRKCCLRHLAYGGAIRRVASPCDVRRPALAPSGAAIQRPPQPTRNARQPPRIHADGQRAPTSIIPYVNHYE